MGKLTLTPHPSMGRKPQADHTLFAMRMRELDREFARQTKQLAKLTRQLKQKIISHL